MDFQLSLGILPERLGDHSAELAGLGPGFAFRQANAIIGNDDAAAGIADQA